jgi:hypothetical protein
LQNEGAGWGQVQRGITTASPSVTKNWRRLLLAAAEKRPGKIRLYILGDTKLIKRRKLQEQRRLKVDTYKHWNVLIRKALQRISSL